MADHENNNEGRNPSPWFLLSSNAQDHAINKVFDTINHCDATTPAYSPRLVAFPSQAPSIQTKLWQRKASDKGKHRK